MSKESIQRKQKFLLTFFNEDKYQEKEVNGFWLIKQWNKDKGKWQVAIYSKEKYQNYKAQKLINF